MASSVDINTHRHQLRPGCSRIKTQSLVRAQTEPSPCTRAASWPLTSACSSPLSPHWISLSPAHRPFHLSLSLPPPLPTLGTMVLDCLTPEAPGRMLVDCGPSDPKVSGGNICVHHRFRPGWSQCLLCVCVPCRPNILTFAKQKPWEVST